MPMDTMKSSIVPYSKRTGPPELIPVIIAADTALGSQRIPRTLQCITHHQLFVKENPTPRTDQTENFRSMACS
jgi:hypothetical protein